MASALQKVITSIRMNDYTTLIILTAVGYDYILVFSDEVEYIWNKPWTCVSMLFVLARYSGLSCVAVNAVGDMRFIFTYWALTIFIGVAELAMILRVWALYGRSRFILGILLTLYAIEIAAIVIDSILISTGMELREVPAHVFDVSFCMLQFGSPTLSEIGSILQMILGFVMCLLYVIQFIREASQIYNATGHFRLNRYLTLLVREGMTYFLVILISSLIYMLLWVETVPTDGWQMMMIGTLELIPPFVLVPRFILNLRRLYARDLGGRRGDDIDTAFGLGSVFEHDGEPAASVIMFEDAVENEGLPSDERHMEEREMRGGA